MRMSYTPTLFYNKHPLKIMWHKACKTSWPFYRENTYNFVIPNVPLNVQRGNSFNNAISDSALNLNVLYRTLHL